MKSFLDVLVVAVLAITTINGYNKGFVRYILGTLGAVAVIVISFLVTDIFANEIYESFVQPPVTDYIAEKIEKPIAIKNPLFTKLVISDFTLLLQVTFSNSVAIFSAVR